MLDLGQIKKRILKGEQIEEIVEEIDWKEFEELVENILKEYNYRSYHNFRFKTQSRHEIDVLAIKEKINLAIDCKQWSRGRHKKTGLKYAADSQKNRVKHLKKFFKNNILAQDKLGLKENIEFIPMIVTWFEEDIINHDDVFIIPVSKFNQFLLNLSHYV